MPFVTIVFGLALVAQGCFFYFGSNEAKPSMTALIPAFFGLPLLICGVVALKEKLLKHAMHVAAVLGLLGVIGAGMRFLPKLFDFPTDPKGKRATTATGIMFGICVVFVALCVNSFIQARRRRKQGEQAV